MALRLGLRLRALLALFVFSTSLSLPLVSFGHFTLDDDRACEAVSLTAPVPVPGVHFGPLRQTLPPDHCALCHWLRAVGGSRTTAVTTIHAWLEPSPPAVIALPTRRSVPVVVHLPSRAPPVVIG
jgi:hypothetical protein